MQQHGHSGSQFMCKQIMCVWALNPVVAWSRLPGATAPRQHWSAWKDLLAFALFPLRLRFDRSYPPGVFSASLAEALFVAFGHLVPQGTWDDCRQEDVVVVFQVMGTGFSGFEGGGEARHPMINRSLGGVPCVRT